MPVRKALLIILALLALAGAAAVLMSPPVDRPAARHGDFARRFQPVATIEPIRPAGIGSIKQLRPVAIAAEH